MTSILWIFNLILGFLSTALSRLLGKEIFFRKFIFSLLLSTFFLFIILLIFFDLGLKDSSRLFEFNGTYYSLLLTYFVCTLLILYLSSLIPFLMYKLTDLSEYKRIEYVLYLLGLIVFFIVLVGQDLINGLFFGLSIILFVILIVWILCSNWLLNYFRKKNWLWFVIGNVIVWLLFLGLIRSISIVSFTEKMKEPYLIEDVSGYVVVKNAEDEQMKSYVIVPKNTVIKNDSSAELNEESHKLISIPEGVDFKIVKGDELELKKGTVVYRTEKEENPSGIQIEISEGKYSKNIYHFDHTAWKLEEDTKITLDSDAKIKMNKKESIILGVEFSKNVVRLAFCFIIPNYVSDYFYINKINVKSVINKLKLQSTQRVFRL